MTAIAIAALLLSWKAGAAQSAWHEEAEQLATVINDYATPPGSREWHRRIAALESGPARTRLEYARWQLLEAVRGGEPGRFEQALEHFYSLIPTAESDPEQRFARLLRETSNLIYDQQYQSLEALCMEHLADPR